MEAMDFATTASSFQPETALAQRQGLNAINVKVLGIFASLLAEYSQPRLGIYDWNDLKWVFLIDGSPNIFSAQDLHLPVAPWTKMLVSTVMVSFMVEKQVKEVQ